MSKVVAIAGVDVELHEANVTVDGKLCRQALNTHGFEVGLYDAVTFAEVAVAGRPLVNATVKDVDLEPVELELL